MNEKYKLKVTQLRDAFIYFHKDSPAILCTLQMYLFEAEELPGWMNEQSLTATGACTLIAKAAYRITAAVRDHATASKKQNRSGKKAQARCIFRKMPKKSCLQSSAA